MRHAVERFRRESRLVVPRGKRNVQLTGALPEKLSALRINSSDQVVQQRFRWSTIVLQSGFFGEHSLVKTTNGIEGKGPGITLGCDRILQQANDRRPGFRPPIFQCTPKRRDIGKICALGQKARDLHIGIGAVLDFSIQLQEEFPVENHRGVALLGPHQLRLLRRVRVRRFAGDSHQFPNSTFGTCRRRNCGEESLAEFVIPGRIVQNRRLSPIELCDDRLWRRLQKFSRRLPRRNPNRQRVGLGRAIEVIHFDEPEAGACIIRRRDFLDDSHVAQRPRFPAKPSAAAHVGGEDLSLNRSALCC